ncbi:MAG: hypothetical protein JSR87_11670 [Proteobacteria bacterium]|nr:hypothetical protein [Pseudomonadota bacterium]MBS0572287.1 hypothetical protein [Pseudomonadota bacterium]
MLHDRKERSFDSILDDAIADPERLEALRRALRSRVGALDVTAIGRRPLVSRTSVAASAADPHDDSLWDNMPV